MVEKGVTQQLVSVVSCELFYRGFRSEVRILVQKTRGLTMGAMFGRLCMGAYGLMLAMCLGFG